MTNAKKPKTCICYYPSNFKSNKAGITELLRNKTHLCLGTPFGVPILYISLQMAIP